MGRRERERDIKIVRQETCILVIKDIYYVGEERREEIGSPGRWQKKKNGSSLRGLLLLI
jgi:hypothetical protein